MASTSSSAEFTSMVTLHHHDFRIERLCMWWHFFNTAKQVPSSPAQIYMPTQQYRANRELANTLGLRYRVVNPEISKDYIGDFVNGEQGWGELRIKAFKIAFAGATALAYLCSEPNCFNYDFVAIYATFMSSRLRLILFATEQVGLEGDLGAYTVACLNLLPRTNWASGPRSMGLCRLLSEPSLETSLIDSSIGCPHDVVRLQRAVEARDEALVDTYAEIKALRLQLLRSLHRVTRVAQSVGAEATTVLRSIRREIRSALLS
uniref:Uncharacterized protein n=1 Tax=Fagus sylvatica TaxID=28930 RepID=A0A2N9FFQ6_FAGSY